MTLNVQDHRDYRVEAKEVVPPPPWWEQVYFGLPVWAWILIGAGSAAAIGGVAYIIEEERRRALLLALARR